VTPKTYVPLPGEDTYPRTVYVACTQPPQGKQAERGGEFDTTDHKATTQLIPTGPPKLYAVSDFSFWFHASSLAFCVNHTAHLDVQQRPAALCISNATAWI